MSTWLIYQGTGVPHEGLADLPDPPPWRVFFDDEPTPFDPAHQSGPSERWPARAAAYQADQATVEMVNTALYLRRPLLVTGDPGVGKSSIAYAVARELGMGEVLRWPISSRSTLKEGLYQYDAMGRLEDTGTPTSRTATTTNGTADATQIGRYFRLGPLGTALAPYARPRVLLVDEIDKGDFDLPNDLLDVFEEGLYRIPELTRLAFDETVPVRPADDGDLIQVAAGRVRCRAFPFVVMTSNGERDFPPAFLRRSVRLHLQRPDERQLRAIVEAHLGDAIDHADMLIAAFLSKRSIGELATDQLLQAIYLAQHALGASNSDERALTPDRLAELVLQQLSQPRT
ncbi:MoxR family ATPase [Streptosporangiaceae bacterium NEAU-GS5]|nr:MoxR family ATPase [Streptosporangiaceae bacterium NEAU-GS5]